MSRTRTVEIQANSRPLSFLKSRVLLCTMGSLAFAALTAVGAMIQIPLQPVPITLQTMFVVLGGAILGPGFGALGQVFYLVMGSSGIPVFAGSAAGMGILTGPTGGYLIGFALAAVLVGRLIRLRTSFWWQLLTFYLGSQVILSLGVLHLGLFYTDGFREAFTVGYLPFIPGDLLKIVATTSIYRSYVALRRTRFSG